MGNTQEEVETAGGALHPKPVLTRRGFRRECRAATNGKESGVLTAWMGVGSVVQRASPRQGSEPVMYWRESLYFSEALK